MSSKRSPRRKEPQADWTAWGLHLIFGMIVGSALGVFLAFRMQRFGWLQTEGLVSAVLSLGLVTAALSSHFGDRLWMRSSVFGPEEPKRSILSSRVSLGIGVVGVLWLIGSLDWESRSSPHETPWVFLPLFGLIGGILLHAIREGTILLPYGFVHQHEHPLLFWIGVAFYGISFLAMIRAGIW